MIFTARNTDGSDRLGGDEGGEKELLEGRCSFN